jgi:hypothetical protein
MRKALSIIFTALLFSCIFYGCRKDIDVPSTTLEKLFGDWDWYETSGGLDGNVYTPYTNYYNMRVKFTEKGIYKAYKNDTHYSKAKFELTVGATIFGDSLANLITYHDKTGFLGSNEITSTQSINFWGEDTLILIDESMDGYNHYYVRRN